MATASEKEALGLLATATDVDVLARINALVAAQSQEDRFSNAAIEALGLPVTATDAEVMERIHALTNPIAGEAGVFQERSILVIWSRSGREFRRGTYVIPADGALVLNELEMDPIDIAELEADAAVGKVRTSEPLTPVSDIQRYTRAARVVTQ